MTNVSNDLPCTCSGGAAEPGCPWHDKHYEEEQAAENRVLIEAILNAEPGQPVADPLARAEDTEITDTILTLGWIPKNHGGIAVYDIDTRFAARRVLNAVRDYVNKSKPKLSDEDEAALYGPCDHDMGGKCPRCWEPYRDSIAVIVNRLKKERDDAAIKRRTSEDRNVANTFRDLLARVDKAEAEERHQRECEQAAYARIRELEASLDEMREEAETHREAWNYACDDIQAAIELAGNHSAIEHHPMPMEESMRLVLDELDKVKMERSLAVARADKSEAIINEAYSAFSSCEFMDPPDGGDPGLPEMVRRLQVAYNDEKKRKFVVKLPLLELPMATIGTSKVFSLFGSGRNSAIKDCEKAIIAAGGVTLPQGTK